MSLLIERDQLNRMKFCPFCGEELSVGHYEGDYTGYTMCQSLTCDEDLEFADIQEYKHRYPIPFQRWCDDL